jgi:hypothetical protein
MVRKFADFDDFDDIDASDRAADDFYDKVQTKTHKGDLVIHVGRKYIDNIIEEVADDFSEAVQEGLEDYVGDFDGSDIDPEVIYNVVDYAGNSKVVVNLVEGTGFSAYIEMFGVDPDYDNYLFSTKEVGQDDVTHEVEARFIEDIRYFTETYLEDFGDL